MRLTVNGSERVFKDGVRSAGDLLAALDIRRERVAVVINEAVVRRAELDSTPVREGDVVEVITMVGGG